MSPGGRSMRKIHNTRLAALVVFTDLNPALLFIAGVICAFVAVIRDAQGPDCGSAVPADSLVDSETL